MCRLKIQNTLLLKRAAPRATAELFALTVKETKVLLWNPLFIPMLTIPWHWSSYMKKTYFMFCTGRHT
jgi:hypothetical protein